MSRQRTTRVLTIDSLKRGLSSYYGNPSFWVTFSDGTRARTATDSSIAYAIENREYRGVPLDVTFEGDRIVMLEVAK